MNSSDVHALDWALNPHPTLIPAIESGWVKSIHSFGSGVGMDEYIRARPDVFFSGANRSLRSNRVLCQLAGQYAVDAFVGATLQMDGNYGPARWLWWSAEHGIRSSRTAALHCGMARSQDQSKPARARRKLLVQTIETFAKGGVPVFVETLDAVEVGRKAGMPIAPIMIYGDDVSHVVTEEGIAYLYKPEGLEECRRALAAVAGVSPVGLKAKPAETADLRRRGIVAYPEDIGVHRLQAIALCSRPAAWKTSCMVRRPLSAAREI